jgi:hypothetical protein
MMLNPMSSDSPPWLVLISNDEFLPGRALVHLCYYSDMTDTYHSLEQHRANRHPKIR